MRKYILILITLISNNLYSQYDIIIVDSASNQALPYVTVRDVNSENIKLTDSLGRIKIPENSIINISCLGYESETIKKLYNKDTIYLKGKTEHLEEVYIKHKPKKFKEFGFHNNNWGTYRFSNVEKQFYPSTYIKNESNNKKTYISKIFLKIKSKNEGKIRLHLYDFNKKSNTIENEILNKNIILNLNNSRKAIEINLSELKIPFPENGLLISVELLEDTESIKIAIAKSKIDEGFTYYVNPRNFQEPIQIPMGRNKLSYMFGVEIFHF